MRICTSYAFTYPVCVCRIYWASLQNWALSCDMDTISENLPNNSQKHSKQY